MRVTVVDNRDSFTFNLVQAFGELGAATHVVDGPRTSGEEILSTQADLVCVGPGPRGPADLPQLVQLVDELLGKVPLLGVCLGLQALVRSAGGRVDLAQAPVHGERSAIVHDATGLFTGLPSPLRVMRYHSLVASEVPEPLTITARDEVGQVMALADEDRRAWALQFHPESIGTEGGLVILANALRMIGLSPEVPLREGSIPAAGQPAW